MDPTFIQTIKKTFGAQGQTWLESLPDLIAEASRKWGLTNIQPVPNLSYNFVAFAKQRGDDVILKIGVLNKELTSEMAALRLYAGQGACRMLAADEKQGMFLLERLQPGKMLSELEDDEQATRIAAGVMEKLWQSGSGFSSQASNFIQLRDWFDGFRRLRQRYQGGTGELPEDLVDTAESLSRDLFAENEDESLLHGDFHHFNLLESTRGWLAIDPKGVIGPRGYEVGPFLINPNDHFLNRSNPRAQTERRIAILSEMLGMERERIRAWGICHAVLSAWWSLEEGGDWEYALRCARLFQQVGI